MPETQQGTANQDRVPFGTRWTSFFSEREEQVFLVLTLVIGALAGAAVVAFILLTERFGARLYPAGGMGLRRLLVPVAGSLGMGYLLHRYFPDARGSGQAWRRETGSVQSLFFQYRGDAGRVCIGGHGHGVRGNRARPDDLGANDFRDYARLCGHRAVDDFQPGEFLHFREAAA